MSTRESRGDSGKAHFFGSTSRHEFCTPRWCGAVKKLSIMTCIRVRQLVARSTERIVHLDLRNEANEIPPHRRSFAYRLSLKKLHSITQIKSWCGDCQRERQWSRSRPLKVWKSIIGINCAYDVNPPDRTHWETVMSKLAKQSMWNRRVPQSAAFSKSLARRQTVQQQTYRKRTNHWCANTVTSTLSLRKVSFSQTRRKGWENSRMRARIAELTLSADQICMALAFGNVENERGKGRSQNWEFPSKPLKIEFLKP